MYVYVIILPVKIVMTDFSNEKERRARPSRGNPERRGPLSQKCVCHV